MGKCLHCQKPIAIRNPSGYCDHLYYPENCKICRAAAKIKKPIVAFDVDGCLIDEKDKPRKNVIALLKRLSGANEIVVWSGGGPQYAEVWVSRLKLDKYVDFVSGKGNIEVEIAIDDMEVKLGKFNIKI